MSTTHKRTPQDLADALFDAHNNHIRAIDDARLAAERVITTKKRFDELLLAVANIGKKDE